MILIAALLIILCILSLLRLLQLKEQNKELKKISQSQIPIIDLAETFLSMAIQEIGRIKEDVEELKDKPSK